MAQSKRTMEEKLECFLDSFHRSLTSDLLPAKNLRADVLETLETRLPLKKAEQVREQTLKHFQAECEAEVRQFLQQTELVQLAQAQAAEERKRPRPWRPHFEPLHDSQAQRRPALLEQLRQLSEEKAALAAEVQELRAGLQR